MTNPEDVLVPIEGPLALLCEVLADASATADQYGEDNPGVLDSWSYSSLMRSHAKKLLKDGGIQMAKIANTGLEMLLPGARVKVLKSRPGSMPGFKTTAGKRFCTNPAFVGRIPPDNGEDPDEFWAGLFDTHENGDLMSLIADWQIDEETGGIIVCISHPSGATEDGTVVVEWRRRIVVSEAVPSFEPDDEEFCIYERDNGRVGKAAGSE